MAAASLFGGGSGVAGVLSLGVLGVKIATQTLVERVFQLRRAYSLNAGARKDLCQRELSIGRLTAGRGQELQILDLDLLIFIDAGVDDFFQASEIEIKVVEKVASGVDNHGHQSPAAHVLI